MYMQIIYSKDGVVFENNNHCYLFLYICCLLVFSDAAFQDNVGKLLLQNFICLPCNNLSGFFRIGYMPPPVPPVVPPPVVPPPVVPPVVPTRKFDSSSSFLCVMKSLLWS